MIRVIHLGLGAIGQGVILGLLAQSREIQLVGVVDINPDFAGKNLREVMGKSVPALPIFPSIKTALKHAKRADVATVATASQTVQLRATLEELIDARLHVVSSCEELAFPDLRNQKIAAALDRRARAKKVALLGTGVNPGFAMDAFALACTAPCTRVRSIKIIRTLDGAKRRMQLQKKIGAGMTIAQVQSLIRQNKIGHVGLKESVALIARGMGWKLDAITEKFSPLRATRPLASKFFRIQTGQTRGLFMTAAGIRQGQKLIELELTMAFGEPTYDEIRLDADPPLTIRCETGFPGEASTIGLMVNCARLAPTLEPGLRTMLDVLKVRSVGM